MKFVIQNALNASVTVDEQVVGKINQGYVVFIGISDEDDEAIADKMIQKMINLRIFKDENGKTNLSLEQISGELLLISQFTLYADTKKGNRPSFIEAGAPDFSKKMYLEFIRKCRELGFKTEEGEFGADMKVSLLNDGPVTIILDSVQRKKKES